MAPLLLCTEVLARARCILHTYSRLMYIICICMYTLLCLYIFIFYMHVNCLLFGVYVCFVFSVVRRGLFTSWSFQSWWQWLLLMCPPSVYIWSGAEYHRYMFNKFRLVIQLCARLGVPMYSMCTYILYTIMWYVYYVCIVYDALICTHSVNANMVCTCTYSRLHL